MLDRRLPAKYFDSFSVCLPAACSVAGSVVGSAVGSAAGSAVGSVVGSAAVSLGYSAVWPADYSTELPTNRFDPAAARPAAGY